MPHYDVIIIGAGIHGAGVAQAAAARGYKTLVLEKFNIAHGTSSKSSKLIHGGLRYLETGQFKLVYECLRERAILLKQAPELVKLKRFYLPIYQDSKRKPWQIHLGLWIYWLLSGFRSTNRFKKIPEEKWTQLNGLKQKGLLAVFQYMDAQTDDTQLTHAVMKSAQDLGARILTGIDIKHIQAMNNSYVLRYTERQQEHTVIGTTLVNCAGPWANTVLAKFNPPPRNPPDIELVQGSHIILPIPWKNDFYYIESPQDGRAVFIMPWYGELMVGTTEVHVDSSSEQVDKPEPSELEIDYLLECLNFAFPDLNARTYRQQLRSFSGLRVLPKSSHFFSKRSREELLFHDKLDAPNMLTIFGGKLTGYRACAERVMNILKPRLPKRKKLFNTKTLALTAP